MHKIVLHSYYGNGNLGDDAILYATEDVFRRFNINFQVVGHPVPIISTAMGKPISRIPFAKRLLYKRHAQWMLKQIENADALILGGGGIIKDPKYGDISNNLRLIRYMQQRKKPNMIYAVGVSGLWRTKSKILTRQVVEKTDYISCRDPESAMKIEELGATTPNVTGDPAIRVPDVMGICSEAKEFDCEKLNVCFSIRRDYLTKHAIKSLANLVTFFLTKYNAKIRFIPMRTVWYYDDRIVHDLIKKELNLDSNIIFFDRRISIEDFIRELTNITLMIGMPLHSVILPTSIGIPVIAIGYTEDVASYMRYIQAEKYLVSVKEVSDTQLLIEKAEEIFASYNRISRKILSNIGKIKAKMFRDENAILQLTRE